MNRHFRRSLWTGWILLGVVLTLSGCATTSGKPERDINFERVSSERVRVSYANLIHEAGTYTVQGKVSKRYSSRSPAVGHIHVTVIDVSGQALSDTPIHHIRIGTMSRKASFSITLPITPPAGSTIRISHHARSHGHPSSI